MATRDFHDPSSGFPFLNQLVFEHGAGGSLGAWLYSGMPLMEKTQLASGGILRIWIGEAGSWLLASILLLTSLAVHFSFGSAKLSRCKELHLKVRNLFQTDSQKDKKDFPPELIK